MQRQAGEELRVAEFERCGLDHLRRERRIGHAELTRKIAELDDAAQHLALARQTFIMKLGALGRNDLRHFDDLWIFLELVESLAQIHEKEIVEPLRSTASRHRQNARQILRRLHRSLAADRFRDIELARKIAIEIARRHIAIDGKLGHRCFGIAVMREAAFGRRDDFLVRIVWSGHTHDCKAAR